ncbi:hypothetical protein [Inediibacterium massiliense]|uniref:hypothetical protein n=1 Tax=Inediibacterium massiliense TaxID=1658111 RepID=UPI0006B58FFD|nr:hypothetical protein [Inediibacterium massiliense]
MFNDFYSNYYPMMPQMPMEPNVPIQPDRPMTPPVQPPIDMPTTPAPPEFVIGPSTPIQDDINYTQGYLRTQIGQYVKVEFLIGTNMLIDREGTLMDVGISYIILQEPETDDLVLCDIYSIKFVRIFK